MSLLQSLCQDCSVHGAKAHAQDKTELSVYQPPFGCRATRSNAGKIEAINTFHLGDKNNLNYNKSQICKFCNGSTNPSLFVEPRLLMGRTVRVVVAMSKFNSKAAGWMRHFSALPLVLLRRQLPCSFQVFVHEFLLCAWQTGLVSAVVHGVLPFSLNTP